MELRNARQEEASSILELYRSVLGEKYCVWNEYYPGAEEISADLSSGGLYVLCEGDAILGALSVAPENEMDDRNCWLVRNNAREIARVVVSPRHRGKGLAAFMISRLLPELREAGVKSIHLSVAVSNLPAAATYRKLGFSTVGEADMYEGHYYLMELCL